MTAENIEWRAERFELPSCWLADKPELLKQSLRKSGIAPTLVFLPIPFLKPLA